MIKLLLVDDHDIVRTGIAHIIEKERGIEIVGEAGNGEEAIRLAKELQPDVVLMDVNMPRLGGVEATQRIIKALPRTKVIILTVHAEAPFPTRLLDAGASGYLTKGCAASELCDAIRSVYDDHRYIGSDIAQQLALSLLPGAERSPFDDLSNREMEVMMMLIQGDDVSIIADRLSLSPKTVSTYKYRIYEKLTVKNDVELTHLAIRHGIVETAPVLRG